MDRVVADLETDGLLDELTTVHSLVLQDLETGEMVSCTDDSDQYEDIETGLEILAQADRIYFHNAIDFDIPALEIVYPEWEPSGEILDTLVMTRLRFAHIEDRDYPMFKKDILPGNLIGSHKLEAWGYRLEVWKGDYDGGWDEWSPAMQEYCEQDVVVLDRLVKYLSECGLPGVSVRMEHALARYLRQQEINGWPFDVGRAAKLQAKLAAKRQEIDDRLRDEIGWWYASNGKKTPKRSRTMKKNFDVPQHYIAVPEDEAPERTLELADGSTVDVKIRGQYTRLKRVDFNPSSRKHIGKVLQDEYGWEPEVFTPKSGDPKISETILKGLPYDIADDLVEYLTIDKRLGQIAEGRYAWLKQVSEHPELGCNAIHHRCYQKPRTHRQAHAGPNLAQVPANGSPYGEECRELFTVPPGWKMLGSDVSGLELRTLAHYLHPWDNGAYGEEVIEGDVHSRNAEILGVKRPTAKGFIYALIYGAGDAKLGKVIKPTAPEDERRSIGKKARADFMAELPALERLTGAVRHTVGEHGYLRLIDGRRAYPRAIYAALNTLIQGTGAIICKAWVLKTAEYLEDYFGPQGWDGEWAALGFIHDEIQLAVRPEIAEQAGELAVDAVKNVGQAFDFHLPLDADFAVGDTWADTH